MISQSHISEVDTTKTLAYHRIFSQTPHNNLDSYLSLLILLIYGMIGLGKMNFSEEENLQQELRL